MENLYMKAKKIELLAPAGDLESFYNAINNGADAVYISGNKFGARAYATNFNEEEIKTAIREAHLLGVKVYVTVNTLIKDSEMNEVLSFVNFLYKENVDAILIQDIGLAHILRNIFPDLVLHASTQMNVHSVDEARKLKSWGFKRIVLGRECDIDLIKKIKQEVDIEIEVFAHGALCMSNSGQCYISSFIGKRSGNRGRCGGACRLPYELVKNNEVVGNKAYYLSLKDLYTLNKVEDLIDANVDSLKIEGRLKRKEYVGLVTKSYREAIDGNIDENKRKYQLQEMFNRGFTSGHIFKDENTNQTNIESPNHIGIRIGKTIRTFKNTVYIKLDTLPKWDNLELNDSIRIKNDTLEDGLTLNKIDICDEKFNVIRRASEAKKGNIIKIESHINLMPNMEVLKTSTAKLIKEFSNIDKRKRSISGKIFKTSDDKLALKLLCDNIEIVETSDMSLEESNNPTMKERIKEQISKINNTCFVFEKIENEIDNVFLPIKEINELRRKAIASLEEAILSSYSLGYNKTKFKSKVEEYLNEFRLYAKVRTLEQYQACKDNGIKYILTEEENLRSLDVIYMNPRNALVSPGFSEDGKISGVYKNVFNAYAVHYLHKIGVETVGLSIELSKDEIAKLIENYNALFTKKPNLMMMVYGHYEVMLMKHCLINKFNGYKKLNCKECINNQYYLKDKLDYEFPLVRGHKCSLKLLNSMRLHLIKYLNDIKDLGVNNLLLDFTIESKEETGFIIENYMASLDGRIFIRDIEKATYGHYKEEIE